MALGAAFLGWLFDGLEMGLFPLVERPALQNLLHTTDNRLVGLWGGVITAGFLVGAATGGVLFGWLGDRIGRVRAMALSIATYAVFSGLCGFSESTWQLFALRFIAALGMGGEWSLGVSLVMELWPNRSRGWLAGLIGAASNVGFATIAVAGMGLNQLSEASLQDSLQGLGLSESLALKFGSHAGWRVLMLLGAAPALLTFLIRLFVPESERWLHERGRGVTSHWATRDLIGVLIGACGALLIVWLWAVDSTDLGFMRFQHSLPLRLVGLVVGLLVTFAGYTYPVIRYLQRAQKHHDAIEVPGETPTRQSWRPILGRMLIGACLSGVALIGTWGSLQRVPAWVDTMVARDVGDAPNATQLRTSARAWTQFVSAIGAIVGTMLAALVGNWIGRRITYCLLCVGSLASAIGLFWLNTHYGAALLVWVFLAGGLTASFYGWLPLYLPELFPTAVRATGQGFAYNFGRVLAAVGALQMGFLMNTVFNGSYPKACLIISMIYVVGMGIIWLAPETHGKPLPE